MKKTYKQIAIYCALMIIAYNFFKEFYSFLTSVIIPILSSGFTIVSNNLEEKTTTYKKVYSLANELCQKTYKLYPPLDNSSWEDKREKLDSVVTTYLNYEKTINENQPFYSKKVFNLLHKIKILCAKEHIEFKLFLDKKENTDNYYQFDSFERRPEIIKNLKALSSLIEKKLIF